MSPRKSFFRSKAAGAFVRFVPSRDRLWSEDRWLLETVIFRELMFSGDYRRVLFAGCKAYTRWYPALFHWFSPVRFSTIEPDPDSARFGSRHEHIIGPFGMLLNDPSKRGKYDCVVLNGVFGFGIDTEAAKKEAFETAWNVLRPGGMLIIGYNDLDSIRDGYILRESCRFDRSIVDPSRFGLAPVPGLGSPDFLVPGDERHRYLGYVKR